MKIKLKFSKMTKNYVPGNKVVKKTGGKSRITACFFWQNWTCTYNICTK